MQAEEIHPSPLSMHLLDLQTREDLAIAEVDAAHGSGGAQRKRLEQIRLSNAHALEAVIEAHGWPTANLVDKRAAAAAFQIAVNASSYPPFQLWCLEKITAAYRAGA